MYPCINVFESYFLMAELLNPEHAYKYKKENRNLFTFIAKNDIEYFCKIVYQPLEKNPFLEFKLGWLDESGKHHYEKSDNIEYIDEFRSDTIAKIWRDEILPIYKNQDLTDKLVINPLNKDIKRYLFALKMIQKFKEDWFNIIEDKPKLITLINNLDQFNFEFNKWDEE